MLIKMENLKGLLVIGVLLGLVVLVGTYKGIGQEQNNPRQRVLAHEEWEYLAVAGPYPASVSDDPHNKKEPNVRFGREAFALEQHLDQLGANGWELVAVAGPPTDPAYYFKRRK